MGSETKRKPAPRSFSQSTSFSTVSRYGPRGSNAWIKFLRGGRGGTPVRCTVSNSFSIRATMDGSALLP